ncbi:PAPA-1-like conserved region-domain-containing protein [Lentinula aff. detonsa]|uniref:PAPA-1-like conserved region-domain-containing protein n=1 Tax=Lentinula aff. detonsa TaxID=2804958 RepID=A0AA38KD13_9AGAR|nr:PAPA-1-like conserved region-domain-containing protein [Lentinula aff. detonsa]
MTTRQAVLASVVDSSHIALGNSSKKKKVLNETELALRREENARKRKNLSEKRLEDEKLETINRLLKKQTRPRTKRTGGEEGDVPDGSSGGSDRPKPAQGPVVPMFKWVSTSIFVPATGSSATPQPAPSTVSASSNGGIADNSPLERRMQFYLAIPVAFLPLEDQTIPTPVPLPETRPPATCAVSGCVNPQKYRLVRDWKIGACGMAHLKVLEGMI